jgi:hypothetical protein
MSKELYSCKIEITKNDINKLLSIFSNNSIYKKYIKNIECNYELLFYEDYFMYVGDNETKYSYNDFNKVIETDNDFYLTNDNIVIYLPKRDMDYKFIGFIRKVFDNIDNQIGEDIGIKNVSKFHDSKVMKKVLFICLIVTIVSFFLALGTWYLVINIYNVDEFMKNSYRWVMLFYLPIPIVTTILGWIYYKRGHKCFKNVVVGVLVFFSILGFGVSAFREENLYNEFRKDISLLNDYKDIMKLDVVPKKGELYFIQDIEDCYTVGDESISCDYVIAEIEDYEEFENKLFVSEYWNTNDKLINGADTFIYDYDMKSYYSIYNKTLDEYNVIPSDEGIYELYIMEYMPSMAYLKIIEIDYVVK